MPVLECFACQGGGESYLFGFNCAGEVRRIGAQPVCGECAGTGWQYIESCEHVEDQQRCARDARRKGIKP
jgi:hypothetical protein